MVLFDCTIAILDNIVEHCHTVVIYSDFNTGHQHWNNVGTIILQHCGAVATLLRFRLECNVETTFECPNDVASKS